MTIHQDARKALLIGTAGLATLTSCNREPNLRYHGGVPNAADIQVIGTDERHVFRITPETETGFPTPELAGYAHDQHQRHPFSGAFEQGVGDQIIVTSPATFNTGTINVLDESGSGLNLNLHQSILEKMGDAGTIKLENFNHYPTQNGKTRVNADIVITGNDKSTIAKIHTNAFYPNDKLHNIRLINQINLLDDHLNKVASLGVELPKGVDFTHIGMKESLDFTADIQADYQQAVKDGLIPTFYPDGVPTGIINNNLGWTLEALQNSKSIKWADAIKLNKEVMNEVESCETAKPKPTPVQKKVKKFIENNKIPAPKTVVAPDTVSHVERVTASKECPCDSLSL